MELYWIKQYINQLKHRLKKGKTFRDKNFVKDNYATTGLRDLDFYFKPHVRRCVVDDKLAYTNTSVIREYYINTIAEQITKYNIRSVLEVGAGTSLNMYLLHQKFPFLKIAGIDLVPERVQTGKKYFNTNNNYDPDTRIADVTNLPFANNEFDMIYSVHCFEQLDRYAEEGIKEVIRVASKLVVFLEPDWEYSNAAQKMFLSNNNYLKNFEQKLSKTNHELIHIRLGTYFNTLNRTGLYLLKLKK
jgi:ubiquinone/menaquinone biosynthesis C-methylase UbiE